MVVGTLPTGSSYGLASTLLQHPVKSRMQRRWTSDGSASSCSTVRRPCLYIVNLSVWLLGDLLLLLQIYIQPTYAPPHFRTPHKLLPKLPTLLR